MTMMDYIFYAVLCAAGAGAIFYFFFYRDKDDFMPSEKAPAYVKRAHRTKSAWWRNKKFVVFFTVFCATMDCLVLYTVMDKAILSNKYLSMLTSFGISMILNMIPVFLSRLYHQAVYMSKSKVLVQAIVAIGAFIILYGATVYLRVSYHDMYGQSSAVKLVNTLDSNSAEEEVDAQQTSRSYAVVILLAIEPLASSMCCFVLNYMTDDELERDLENAELERYQLRYDIARIKAGTLAMQNNVDRELEIDSRHKSAAIKLAVARGQKLKADARSYLAMYLRDPESISRLSNDPDSEDITDTCTVYDYPQEENPFTVATQLQEV